MPEKSNWAIGTFDCEQFTDRAEYLHGEGGALNANYRTVDAVATICAQCGNWGLRYGTDFWFESAGLGQVTFTFKDEKYITMLGFTK